MFFSGLELIVTFHRWLYAFLAVLFVLLMAGIWLVRFEEGERFQFHQVILPSLAVIGLTSFSLFLPYSPLLHLYFALAALLFFWLLKHGSKQAYPTWNWTIATTIFYCNAAVVLGLRFHFFLPVLLTLILLFVLSFLISVQAVRRLIDPPRYAVLLALCLAIAITELAWVLLFLPAHFLVLAGVLVVFYHVAFHLFSVSAERPVHLRDVAEYGIIAVIALLMLFASARWQ